jgi:hypothetical protein
MATSKVSSKKEDFVSIRFKSNPLQSRRGVFSATDAPFLRAYFRHDSAPAVTSSPASFFSFNSLFENANRYDENYFRERNR